jgi:predicted MFS family arabinose efflux permease
LCKIQADLALKGLGYGIIGLIAILLIRERIPVPKRTNTGPRRKIPLGFAKRNTFWWFAATILLTSLGNFLPSVYLPSFAADIGLSSNTGTLLVSIMK